MKKYQSFNQALPATIYKPFPVGHFSLLSKAGLVLAFVFITLLVSAQHNVFHGDDQGVMRIVQSNQTNDQVLIKVFLENYSADWTQIEIKDSYQNSLHLASYKGREFGQPFLIYKPDDGKLFFQIRRKGDKDVVEFEVLFGTSSVERTSIKVNSNNNTR